MDTTTLMPQNTIMGADKPDGALKQQGQDPRIFEYKTEYDRWLEKLDQFHTNRFNRNYRSYTAYSEVKGTHTKISDPVAPELVERVVQKFFERDPKFYSMARGRNLPKELTTLVSNVAQYLWTNPEIVQATGPMRTKLKLGGREFCVIGNVAVETYYNGKADSADFRVLPIEDVIFNPSKTLKTSEVYYVRQWVSLDYIDKMAEVTEDGEVVSGIFNAEAVALIKTKYADKTIHIKDDPDQSKITRTGSNIVSEVVEDILLVSRYEGKHVCRLIDWEVIGEEFDNDILDDDPLDFAMDIEVPKQPYGFSMLDFISGITHAKDLLLNQIVDYGSKALNPPLFVDPAVSAVNRRTLVNAFKVGGIVFAAPNQITHAQMPPLPTVGFDFLNYAQQRAESVTGIGAYLGGVPNQTSDKTNGTASGIAQLTESAQSPLVDRQKNLEESIVEPVINKMLKLVGATMGQNELKWVLISGENPQWVQVTKGLLTGKIMVQDLLMANLVHPEEVPELIQMMTMQGQQSSGDPMYQFDPTTEVVFDVDWVVRVEAGSMAEADMEKDLQAFDGWINFNMTAGIPMDMMKVSIERAARSGIKEPEQYLVSPQQVAEQNAAAAAAAGPSVGGTSVGMPPPGAPPQAGPTMPQPAPQPANSGQPAF